MSSILYVFEHDNTGAMPRYDYQKIIDAIWPARTKWHNLGLALSIDPNDLDVIRQDNELIQDRIFQVIHTWLKTSNPDPTTVWENLAGALEKKTVGEQALATELRRKGIHCIINH